MPPAMSAPQKSPLVFISAAEPSADLHAASLIRAVHRLDPNVRFAGIAGPKMVEAGCHRLFDMTSQAAMLGGIFRVVPQALKMLRVGRQYMADQVVDLAVVIDSPMLNLPMAKYAKRFGVPVLYYIAPQLWAWGRWRARRVRKRVDKLAVILPFEQEYFRTRGVDAEFVGHPLFDTLERRSIDAERVGSFRSLGQPLVAVLPGSRTHVVEEVLPGQLEVARAVASSFPNAHFCFSVANDRTKSIIAKELQHAGLRHSLHNQENAELLTACDLALVASGTATLETAYYHAPMIVMYNASRLIYQLVGRWVINTKNLSLVNILAGNELVPEFMPYYRSTEPIIKKALELLGDSNALDQMKRKLEELMKPLVTTGAANNAANIVLEMISETRTTHGHE